MLGTHMDNCSDLERELERVQDVLAAFNGRQRLTAGFNFTIATMNTHTGKGMSGLVSSLLELVQGKPPERIPNAVIQLEEDLKELNHRKKTALISQDTFTEFCQLCGVAVSPVLTFRKGSLTELGFSSTNIPPSCPSPITNCETSF